MSIPLVFKPVEADSMLLYDGGIYDNFPWKPLDATFGPDFIVGSVCTSGNTPPSGDSNIMDQAFMLAMQETDYTLPEGRSVTIRRAVDAGMLDFDRAEAIMDSGYEDAMAAMPEILRQVAARRGETDYAARAPRLPREVSPADLQRLPARGADADPAGLYPRLRAGGPPHAGRQRPMGFAELRDNLFEVLAGGEFSMGFPTCATIRCSGATPSRRISPRAPTSGSPSAATSPRRPSTRPTSVSTTSGSAASDSG